MRRQQLNQAENIKNLKDIETVNTGVKGIANDKKAEWTGCENGCHKKLVIL